jgi:3',5'-cyclic AMP phosphodiesterase CpdA
MKKIVHFSDIHFGTEVESACEAFITDINRECPDLVVMSGDVTQRGRTKEYKTAKQFLSRVRFPMVVIPGNHDLPAWNPLKRFFGASSRFQKYISSDMFPFYRDKKIAVLGVNTSRALRWSSGSISAAQVNRIREKFLALPSNLIKVVVLHHNIMPSRGKHGERLLGHAKDFFLGVRDCGIDIVLTGHLHDSYTNVLSKDTTFGKPLIVSQAGTAVSRRVRNGFNEYNLVHIGDRQVQISIKRLREGNFVVDQIDTYDLLDNTTKHTFV